MWEENSFSQCHNQVHADPALIIRDQRNSGGIMDEHNSLQKLHYGFNKGGRLICSNLPTPHLADWLTRLEDADKKRAQPFLNGKNLVLIDCNQHYLDYLLAQLFPDFISQAACQKEPIPRQEHHVSDSFLDVYQAANGSPLRKIYGRVKGLDSITEKLARKYAQLKSMKSERPELPLHAVVEDVYAFTVVAQDEATLYQIENELKESPHLRMIDKKDYLEAPKASGYRALHSLYLWQANTLPPGLVVEVHLETAQDHQNNRQGTPEHPERAHPTYSRKKLWFPHRQGEHQLLILQKNGHHHQKISPVKISNDYVNYFLVNY